LNRYLEIGSDYAALGLLRYYMIHRALVRAKVRALAAGPPRSAAASAAALAYAQLAQELCRPLRPTLVITHGFSGSGKTTWTSTLLAALPALRLRSDVFRKRQAGLDELSVSHSPVGGGLYSRSKNESVYDALAVTAGETLRAGYNVIVDATFLRRSDRARFAMLAADVEASFRILHLAADPDTLRARIARRSAQSRDPSEATLDVLDWQLSHADALDADELARTIRIDTEIETPARIDAAFVARVLEQESGQGRKRDRRQTSSSYY
jgi:predicted kinase